MLRYTLLRVLVFFGCLAALWLLGLRDEEDMLLLVAGAAVLSAVISYVALRRFREDYSAQLAARLEERSATKRARAADRPSDEDVEDAEVARPRPTDGEGDFR
ncbi:DUF4229 domain-containing protein [Oryzobacter sp. R7]|uniref:DUF4229 domain-containing protein n=1 Tax=Oryzobacter faecalis TaxID=3388656 RepID=UPI00398CFF1C